MGSTGKKGRPPKRRAPADKKRLSYAKDRRDDYGQNNKASRRLIPARKAAGNRADRRATHHVEAAFLSANPTDLEVQESDLRHDVHRVGGWRKARHGTLSDRIRRQAEARRRRKGRKQGAPTSPPPAG